MTSETFKIPRRENPSPAPAHQPPPSQPGPADHAADSHSAQGSHHSHKRLWFSLLAIVLIGCAFGGWFAWRNHSAAAADARANADASQRAIPVVASAARHTEMPIYLKGLGSVTPLNTVTVHTRVDGEIDKINFVEGQVVHAGELLVQIDPRPFQVQLTLAQGQLAKDEAALHDSQLILQRDKEAADALPRQTIDTQQATVDQNEGAIKVDQGNIDSAKLNLIYSRITAPVTGRIGLKQIDQGNIVHAADVNGLAVITQLQPITVVFTLPQDNIPQVVKSMSGSSGMPAVDAYDREDQTLLARGKLMAIGNQVDPGSGTFQLKAIFDNTDNALFPNQFVNAHILVDTLHNVVVVPAPAVQHGPDPVGAFVFVVKPDNTVEVRSVTPGWTDADVQVITAGLDSGERVVVDGFDKLQNGSHVTLRASTTNPSATQPATRAAHHRGSAA